MSLLFFVVVIHLMEHSGYFEQLNNQGYMYYVMNYILWLIRVAVPVFVIITGYLGISFKLDKIINLEMSLLFYGFVSFCLALMIDAKSVEFSVMSIMKTILPFSYNSWWFATCYIVLMIFSPFINILLDSIDHQKHLNLILACFILFNVISSYSPDPIDKTSGYGFTNFIFLYIVGRYIRKYDLFCNIQKNIGYIYILFLVC